MTHNYDIYQQDWVTRVKIELESDTKKKMATVMRENIHLNANLQDEVNMRLVVPIYITETKLNPLKKP